MLNIRNGAVNLHARVDGAANGPVVMFANSLGTDLRVWDPILPHLPSDLRILRYDKRGHGLSDTVPGPGSIEDLASDAAAVIDQTGMGPVIFVGLSIGGLIGQALALSRPDCLKGLVLMDTAAKIGTPQMWGDRIAALKAGGIAGMAEAVLDRWFAEPMRSDSMRVAPWRNMLCHTPLEGYIFCCEAIAAADYRARLSEIRVPVLTMAGSEDQATPPETLREAAEALGAPFHEIPGAGHLPCVENPVETARLITNFLKEIKDV